MEDMIEEMLDMGMMNLSKFYCWEYNLFLFETIGDYLKLLD